MKAGLDIKKEGEMNPIFLNKRMLDSKHFLKENKDVTGYVSIILFALQSDALRAFQVKCYSTRC